MRKSVILAAAVALSVATVPSIISQAQAAKAKKHDAHAQPVRAAQERAPAKDPNCNNGFQKGNMNWQEHYHCF